MNFHQCRLDDLMNLQHLMITSYRDHYCHLWSDQGAHYLNSHYNQAALENALEDLNVEIYFLEVAQEKLGFVKIILDSGIDPYSAEDTLELEKIYFLKKATARGLGKQSLDFVEQRTQDLNKSFIWLKSMAFGPVVQFYQKNGFKVLREAHLKSPYILDQYRKMYVWIKKV